MSNQPRCGSGLTPATATARQGRRAAGRPGDDRRDRDPGRLGRSGDHHQRGERIARARHARRVRRRASRRRSTTSSSHDAISRFNCSAGQGTGIGKPPAGRHRERHRRNLLGSGLGQWRGGGRTRAGWSSASTTVPLPQWFARSRKKLRIAAGSILLNFPQAPPPSARRRGRRALWWDRTAAVLEQPLLEVSTRRGSARCKGAAPAWQTPVATRCAKEPSAENGVVGAAPCHGARTSATAQVLAERGQINLARHCPLPSHDMPKMRRRPQISNRRAGAIPLPLERDCETVEVWSARPAPQMRPHLGRREVGLQHIRPRS